MPVELGAAKAVMGTAGMSLVSESVWLKKPFFGIPIKNEYEQTVNAMTVQRLRFGDFSEEPTHGQIEHFLSNLATYRRSLEDYRFDPDAAARKLLELIAALPASNRARWADRPGGVGVTGPSGDPRPCASAP
jgi:UDP:flavonoid glycosyltransferase YjiC (YdhE family)